MGRKAERVRLDDVVILTYMVCIAMGSIFEVKVCVWDREPLFALFLFKYFAATWMQGHQKLASR